MKNRIRLISLMLFFLGYSALLSAQNPKITLNLRNVTLKDAMERISAQSKLNVAYSPEFVDSRTTVSVKAENSDLDAVMKQMLGNTDIGYRITDKEILLFNTKTIPAPHKESRITNVTGEITDRSTGLPMAGVAITTDDGKGTVSNAEGKFSIQAAEGEPLLFRSLGYRPQTIPAPAAGSLKVLMENTDTRLDEIVVVGYGTQKVVNLTGAVEAVGAEVFENRSVTNTTQALQGAVPNLNISLEDGKPGRSAEFNVRGQTSIGQGGSALILIDGVEGDPSFLNPNDIESVSVLKDAASSAIYGARGSFGVVLITTKRPQKGRTTVNYTGNFSIQSQAKKPEYVTDGVTWLEHFREAYYNTLGVVPTSINNDTQYYSDEWLERMRAWKASGDGPKTVILPNGDYEYYSNTDWNSLLFKDHTFAQDHNVTVSGGNEKADFYVSGRLYKFDGLYNFNPDTYKSYNIRAKASMQAYKWLKVSNNMEFARTDYHQPFTAQGWTTANVQRYLAVTAFPTQPMYNPDGTYTRSGAGTLGGFADGNNYQDNTRNLFKNTVGFNTNFLDNTLRINGDYTFRYDNRDYFRKRTKTEYYQNAFAEKPSTMGDTNGVIYEWMGYTMYTSSNIYGEYENTFAEKHYLKAMGGWNYETSNYKANSIQRNNLLLEGAESIALATGDAITPGASVSRWKTAGIFFRLNYGYRDRYLVEVNGRYDGSSRFPTDQQWGFFPSISGGWRLSEESFWKVNPNIVSDVKFRVSYGSLGNGNISPYQFLEILNITNSGRVLDGNLNKSTRAPEPIPNGLTWEKVTTTNFGIDVGLLNNRLRLNGDYYIRKTTDMYVVGPVLPEIFGADPPKGNYADMTTKGFEISVAWRSSFNVGKKPFNYEVRGTLYDYTSVIDKFFNPTRKFTEYYKGMKIGELWGFETDGLFDYDPSPDEYINTIFKASADGVWRAGDLKIRNRDGSPDNMITMGDGTVDNPGDMTIIGNTEPRYQYSFTVSADWNGIFFSAFFHGVGKQDWYPGTESAFWGQYNRGYNPIPAWHIGNYWTPDNPNAYLPRYAQSNGSLGYTNYVPNDRYIQRISYIRLKSLQIGYNLPEKWLTKTQIKNLRIYVNGENLASWSPLYKRAKNFMDVSSAVGNSDIDMSSSYNQGSGNGYPLLKTFSFGISVTY